MRKFFYEQQNKEELIGENIQNGQFRTYYEYLPPFQDATNPTVHNKLLVDYTYKLADYATETYADKRSQT